VHGALIDAELLARVYLAMTGGQTALSLDASTARTDRRQGAARTARAVRSDLDLVVIRASEAETTAHEALLEKLREAGDCVWDRIDAPSQAAK
jgi:DNA polymerase-3 subunit epsilon